MAAESNFNMGYEGINSQAIIMRSHEAEFQNMLHQLAGQVANLTATEFRTDVASVAFNGAYEQFTAGASKALSALQDMARYLDSAATTVQVMDRELSVSFSAM
ncbi:MAG: WXG100 family type VII secretion target [Propionibacteriaceae bacterium]|jgi:uncharacterized protein YukE|nr:WXG100 family type VII secretion target [Propionibacteriaceae bacterium]